LKPDRIQVALDLDRTPFLVSRLSLVGDRPSRGWIPRLLTVASILLSSTL